MQTFVLHISDVIHLKRTVKNGSFKKERVHEPTCSGHQVLASKLHVALPVRAIGFQLKHAYKSNYTNYN